MEYSDNLNKKNINLDENNKKNEKNKYEYEENIKEKRLYKY